MKKGISFFLLFLLSWQFAFKAAYVLYWKINQVEITEKYCENKDKPEMDCCGKCHLEKELVKIDALEESDSNPTKFPFEKLTQIELPVFVMNKGVHFCFENFNFVTIKNLVLFHFELNYSFDYNQDCFHPPQV